MLVKPAIDATCIPICASCGVPVERYGIVDPQNIFVLKIWAECHGKTCYVEVPIKEALTKKGVLVFKKKAFNLTRARALHPEGPAPVSCLGRKKT